MLAKIGDIDLANGTRAGGMGIVLETAAANWNVEISQRPRATEVFLFDRGNGQRAFTFSVSRNFATQDAADEFVLEHPRVIDRTELLQLITHVPGETDVVRWLRGAKLESVEFIELKGVHVRVRYGFRGAFISDSETD